MIPTNQSMAFTALDMGTAGVSLRYTGNGLAGRPEPSGSCLT